MHTPQRPSSIIMKMNMEMRNYKQQTETAGNQS